ncbi:ABC transporter substrate-binding protein [Paenibacillus sp. MSJ-34]|uniref:ABC transporter substrate-binding protein n=1 Tax=Paenibacillus sp. MSJ-34 TaxID=2841529 RepID=UPI001C118DAC|nr:extracellular solute-binding protein [Paenibacillus sp. MSJ-34]MBU5442354.1 extracellular solute-binding protein [Paenibacillus sp. MSJ-34]
MRRYGLIGWIFLLAISILVAGCGSKQPAPQEKKTLKIAFQKEEYFYNSYGDYFEAKFPNVKIEIVPTEGIYGAGVVNSNEALASIVREQKPDLLFLSAFQYPYLVQQEMLYDMTPLAERDLKDAVLHPLAIEWLRTNDQGKLYGLNPEFNTKALFYNKSLFDEYGVEYPHDGMTWEEVIRTAERFSARKTNDDVFFGYHEMFLQTPYDLVRRIAYTHRLSYLSADQKQVTIDTESWRQIFQLVIDALKRGDFQPQMVQGDKKGDVTVYGPEHIAQMDLFAEGKAAMTVDGTSLIGRLNGKTFEWGIVTEPIDPANPTRATDYDVYPVLAIAEQSENKETAWEVIRYFMSEEYARVHSKIGHTLTTRIDGRVQDDLNLDPFYKLQTGDFELPTYQGIVFLFDDLLNEQIAEVVQGKKTVEEALKYLQSEGQKRLDEAWIEKEAAK